MAVVVTRWFGGTLLGSGGLIRAYGGTAAECLRLAPKTRLIAMTALPVTLRFSDLAVVKARISAIADSQIVSEVFTILAPDWMYGCRGITLRTSLRL